MYLSHLYVCFGGLFCANFCSDRSSSRLGSLTFSSDFAHKKVHKFLNATTATYLKVDFMST